MRCQAAINSRSSCAAFAGTFAYDSLVATVMAIHFDVRTCKVLSMQSSTALSAARWRHHLCSNTLWPVCNKHVLNYHLKWRASSSHAQSSYFCDLCRFEDLYEERSIQPSQHVFMLRQHLPNSPTHYLTYVHNIDQRNHFFLGAERRGWTCAYPKLCPYVRDR